MGRKKRVYLDGTRFSTYKKYDSSDMEFIVSYVKKHGVFPSGYYVSPHQLEDALQDAYYELVELYEISKTIDKSNIEFQRFFEEKKVEFFNLTQPVWLPLIRKFQIEDFVSLKSVVAIKVFEIVNRKSYVSSRSRLTSQIYENVFQGLLRNFKEYVEQDSSFVAFIDFDIKNRNEV